MPPKKSAKKSIILLINIGATRPGGKNDPSILDKAKNIARRFVEKKIFLKSKDEIAVMLMGAAETKNTAGVEHVTTLRVVQYSTWDLARTINGLKGTDHYSNWVDALLAALKYSQENFLDPSAKQLFMFSDFSGPSTVTRKFKAKNVAKLVTEEKIQLVTIGNNSLEDRPKDYLDDSEIFLRELHKEIEGQHITFEEAEMDLRFYQNETATPAPWYSTLDLIDKRIPIVAYVKVSEDNRKFPSWKIAREDQNITKVTQYIDRHRNIYTAEKTAKGYRYGNSVVVINDVDVPDMEYNGGPKSFVIHSFAKRDDVGMEYWANSSPRVVVPANEADAKVFYSLVEAMHKRDFVAIVRKVQSQRANTVPKMVALFPFINQPDEPWCLVEVELPYADDRRVMAARPMKSIVKQLSQEQNEALDSLLDSLTLTDEDQQSSEYCPFLPGYVPSPAIQYRWHALSHRALYPDKPLPPVDDYLKAVLEVPSVKERSREHLGRIEELFNLENVIPKKKRGGDTEVEEDKPKSLLIDANQSVKNENEAKMDTEDELFKNQELDFDTPEVDLDKLVADF